MVTTCYKLKKVDMSNNTTQYLLEGSIYGITTTKRPRITIKVHMKDDIILLTHSEFNDWVLTDVNASENAHVLTAEDLTKYPCIQTAFLPANWDDLGHDDAMALLDSFD